MGVSFSLWHTPNEDRIARKPFQIAAAVSPPGPGMGGAVRRIGGDRGVPRRLRNSTAGGAGGGTDSGTENPRAGHAARKTSDDPGPVSAGVSAERNHGGPGEPVLGAVPAAGALGGGAFGSGGDGADQPGGGGELP